ncbi:hypothetical protein, partial [Pseudomonas sp. FG-3G]
WRRGSSGQIGNPWLSCAFQSVLQLLPGFSARPPTLSFAPISFPDSSH